MLLTLQPLLCVKSVLKKICVVDLKRDLRTFCEGFETILFVISAEVQINWPNTCDALHILGILCKYISYNYDIYIYKYQARLQ